MKSVGEVLQKAREKRSIPLSSIAAATYIDISFLQAIEANDFEALPSPANVVGFVGMYARNLGLEEQTIIALLRRDYQIATKRWIPHAQSSGLWLEQRRRNLLRLCLLVFFLLSIVSLYAFWSVRSLRQPPRLVILSPQDGGNVSVTIVVKGMTDSDALVEVDGEPVAITQDGEFARELELVTGEHVITVSAKNRYGAQTIKQIVVQVQNKE